MAIDTSQAARLDALPEAGRSIGGNVTSILRKAIIDGVLRPGERLGQDELCARFGVSQAPVREALRRLEAEGLVEHRPNRGVYVLALEAEELLNVVAPTRVLVESYAIRRSLATEREALLTGLETILEQMRAAAAEGDFSAINDLDIAFHELPITLCEQPHTTQLWRAVMPRLRAEFTRLAPEQAIGEIVADHEAMFLAIRNGNRKRIESVLHDHAVTGTKRLLERAGVL